MRRLWTSIAIAALLFPACGREGTNQARRSGPRTTTSPTHRPDTEHERRPTVRAASTAFSLDRFDACPPLLEHLRMEALKRVGPYGLPGSGGYGIAVDAVAAPLARTAAEADTGTTAGAQVAAPGYSSTNIQERNVDEPDVVKTDGRHLFVLRPEPGAEGRQRLTSVAIDGGTPRLAGGVLLPQAFGYELLLAGDRVLAIGQQGGYAVPVDTDAMRAPGFAPQQTGTVIAIVDVFDREDMRITHKLELDGTYVSARMIGGVARLVLNSQPTHIPFEQPAEPSAAAQERALAANKAKIRKAKVEDWLPRFQLQDDSGKVTSEGTISSCASTFRPKTFSGFGETTVVTIDPATPDPRESATVIGSAGTVYASTSNLYVATQEWPQPEPVDLRDGPVRAPSPVPAPAHTSLHRFDITDALRAVYAASGEVRGTVLNQWSLSEHEGFLRVATTEDRFRSDAAPNTSSFVTVLDATASKLDKVGGIDDISPGERIYGVRFMGDTGYMVTFRQIDPLHVIDLADPHRPKLLGELKIPGYSAYLHPVGEHRLLGIGRDADDQGRPLGVSVSLFDTTDASAPTRIDFERLSDTYTSVEHDHHAFTWWQPKRLALIPVELQNIAVSPDGRVPPEKRLPTSYLYGFRVDGDALVKTGRLTHASHAKEYTGQITRSIVVGDTLFSLSGAGIAASDLDSFVERGWVQLS